MKPSVSIVTPTFNSALLITQAIESVQAQTFSDWEMIIVDDYSIDDTCTVVRRYIASDSRIRLISKAENGGPATARNTALKSAKGRYIAFLDSDDLWLPTKLQHQLDFMAEKNAALSYTLYRRFTENSDLPGGIINLPNSFTYHGLLKNTGIAGCLTIIIDTEQTGSVEMTLVHHEDYALWLSLLKRGFVAHGLQVDLARYRVSNTSVSGNKIKSASWVWNIYRNIEKLSIPYAAWCFLNYGWRAYQRRNI